MILESTPRCYGYVCSVMDESFPSPKRQKLKCKRFFETLKGFEWGGWSIDSSLHYGQYFLHRPKAQILDLRLRPGDIIVCARGDIMFSSVRSAMDAIPTMIGRDVTLRLMDHPENAREVDVVTRLPLSAYSYNSKLHKRMGIPLSGPAPLGWKTMKCRHGDRFVKSDWDRKLCQAAWWSKSKQAISHGKIAARFRNLKFYLESRRTVISAPTVRDMIAAYEKGFPLYNGRRTVETNHGRRTKTSPTTNDSPEELWYRD